MSKPASKTIIAIDLDEVIVQTASRIIDYYNSKFGTSVSLVDYYVQSPALWQAKDMDEVSSRLNAYLETPEYTASQPIQEAIVAIRSLRERFKLYIITARPDSVEEATRKWIENNFPDVFEDVLFANFFLKNSKGKGDICTEIGASYLIDDHLTHILHASEAGVTGLLFGDLPWTKVENLPDNVHRVVGWKEVMEYFDEQS